VRESLLTAVCDGESLISLLLGEDKTFGYKERETARTTCMLLGRVLMLVCLNSWEFCEIGENYVRRVV